MKKLFFFAVFTALLFPQSANIKSTLYAGFRASRILESYPNNQFPSINYWVNTGKTIAGKFTAAQPAGIWIVSLYMDNGNTQLNFPANGLSLPYISFISTDQNESYLSRFDAEGIKVWLQVEPGAANMDTLISIVLNRYKNHSCVIGFGVDVEWYQAQANPEGKKVTDAEASRWEAKVKAVNPNYTLFLKHYAQSWMPPSYRGSILFVDDSQEFTSLNSMVSEFKSWGQKFAPNSVAFQYGYPIDSTWWKQYPDPMSKIGSTLLSGVSNCSGLFWVDFTITRVFPITAIDEKTAPASSLELLSNYPNPFNPATIIEYTISEPGVIRLDILNCLGQTVRGEANEYRAAGRYKFQFNANNLPAGVYFAALRAGTKTSIIKMLLLK